MYFGLHIIAVNISLYHFTPATEFETEETMVCLLLMLKTFPCESSCVTCHTAQITMTPDAVY